MTTNQTIDGVPRKALADFIEYSVMGPYGDESMWQADKDKLRALLDADKVNNRQMGLMQFLEAHPIKPAAQPQGEPVALAQGVGILTFMRSTSEDANRCGCCEGDHIFCRYFEGLPDFNDLTQELRHRSDLEGREFRVTVEALPLYAKQPAPVVIEHYKNKVKHLKQLLRNVRATLHFSPEDVLAIDAALREDGE